MSSLCSDESSLGSRARNDDFSWERMSEDKRKEKNSIFSASPWDREKKEKMQQEQVLDARRARDLEIARLESVSEDSRSEKQSEWLRILRLEREFQRRAEMEPDDEEEDGGSSSEEESSDDTATEDAAEKKTNFPRDKIKASLNERTSLKLLDELLEDPTKYPLDKERRTPSEKHFIPLDVTIPDNEISTHSLPMTNNILKISSEQPSDGKEGRSSKPPVPAPRPSKTCTPVSQCEMGNAENRQGYEDVGANLSSLAKLDISDSSAFFCSIENGDHSSRSTPQDNWFEVPSSYEDGNEDDAFVGREPRLKHQNGIYEATLIDARIIQQGDGCSRDKGKPELKMKHQNGIYDDNFADRRSRQQNGMHYREESREQKLRHHNGAHEAVVVDQKLKPNNVHGAELSLIDHKNNHFHGTSSEHSRIYENIKPADYQYLRTQTISGSSFTSHTLPKTVANVNNAPLATKSPPRNGSRPHDKKFPIMGVSSTLTKKGNGYVPSDADILPSLYASCKAQQNGGREKEVPSDLVDKSPEFKKMWISRPEKLTFQDKIRKFSIQAGEEEAPRDRVKNSKAQREIENKFVEAHRRHGYQKPVES